MPREDLGILAIVIAHDRVDLVGRHQAEADLAFCTPCP
jgi:hypothetical protein